MGRRPLISLVVGTKGRSAELVRLLESLCAQTLPDFEVILIDQNEDARVSEAVAPYLSRLRIVHRRPAFSGLSRARNEGLNFATGSIVAFPDDDCEFPAATLECAARLLSAPLLDGICGRLEAPSGGRVHVRSGRRARHLDRYNVWDLALSATIFLKRHLVDAVGAFDEDLGVGSGTPWGSGEETDYLLRALAQGFHLRFEPAVVVWHPPMSGNFDASSLARGLSYGGGLGRVLRKNAAPPWFAASMFLRAMAGACLGVALLRPRMARFHFNVLRGRWRGWNSLSI